MNRNKRLTYKKSKQATKQRKSNYLKLLRNYSVRQWLVCIRNLNIKISNNEYNEQNIYFKFKPEFLTVNADMAIRIARNKTNESDNPTPKQCNWLTQIEIDLTDTPISLIKQFGIGGISLIFVWQNRLIYNQSNMIGRMHCLYKDYNNQVISAIGISIKDIYVILLAILLSYEYEKKTYLKKSALIHPKIESLTKEKVINFLSYFSITPDEYKDKAKKEKIYENSFGKFKYLIRYPIIDLGDDLYILPVFEQLLDTVANNLYFLLLEHFQGIDEKASKTFLDNFGNILENYVLDLIVNVFEKEKIIRADNIVPKDNELRCEVVAFHKDNALAIEVKKMHFKRDAIVNNDKKHIDKVLKYHLVKAFQQIENTLSYVSKNIKYGLIVVPDIMLGFSAMINYMKEEFKGEARFDNEILICTLSWYEALMANEADIIFEILYKASQRKLHEGNDIIMIMQDMKNVNMTNLYLEDTSLKILKTIKDPNTKEII